MPSTDGSTQSFGYDALDRLASTTESYGNLSYSYDANGSTIQ
ncbi:MAG: hypothetical protein U1F68_01895 [Gammaproteobacteria bacterium]